MIPSHAADVRENRVHVELIDEKPATRLRTYDGKVRLLWSSPGYECAGSMMRWTNGGWRVNWHDSSYAIQGRRYLPNDEGDG